MRKIIIIIMILCAGLIAVGCKSALEQATQNNLESLQRNKADFDKSMEKANKILENYYKNQK